MSVSVSVDEAIRSRFARAYETNPGIRIEDDPFPADASSRSTVGVPGSEMCCAPVKLFTPVGGQLHPVFIFQETREGHHVDIENSIEFQAVRTRFRNEDATNGVDILTLGLVKTQNSAGEDVWGPNLKLVRPQAVPESIFYDFHIEARHVRVASALLDMMTALFPPLGTISVTRLDKSIVSFDMNRTTNPFRSSTFDATLTPGDPGVRKYRWTSQYEVEAYSDNTLQGTYQQTITSRCVTPVRILGSAEVVPLEEQP